MQTPKEKRGEKKPQGLETGLAATDRPHKHITADKGSVRRGSSGNWLAANIIAAPEMPAMNEPE